MNKLVDFFSRFSGKQLVGIIIVGSVAIWYLLNLLFLDPVREELTTVTKEVESLENQINTERRIAANLDRYREEVESYKAVQELAQRQLPQKREIAALLTSVQTIARDIGLDVRSFSIGEDRYQDEFAEIPVSVEMQGSFHQVVSFFDEVSRLSRVISVGELKLTDPRGYAEAGSVGLGVQFTLTAYRQLEESEKASKESDSKGKGKSKKDNDKSDNKAKTQVRKK